MFNIKKCSQVISFSLMVFLSACGSGTEPLPQNKIWEKDQKKMVLIPAGEFLMGTDLQDKENTHQQIGSVKPLYLDQQPQHKVQLDAYYIDQYEVTNREYKNFIEATQFTYLPSNWLEGEIPEGEDDLPVTNISWMEAWAYAQWAGKELPTEAQWEKAARGTDGRIFPWGNEYEKGVANVGVDGAKKIMVGGSFPKDVSAYKVYDMAGNVMEWTRDWYQAYPGTTYSSKKFGKKFKVLRGSGSQKSGHYFLEAYIYSFYRTEVQHEEFFENVGFRCVHPVKMK
jgi:formylglycine-generating enzyme required for sulfatase activity